MKAILFDLDGTLIDSAPDLFSALDHLLAEYKQPRLSYAAVRNHVSQGSPAMIRLGFGTDLDADEFEARRLRLLDIYFERLCDQSRPFPGIMTLLDDIEDRGLQWGIVTNKPGWLTEPLLRQLGLYDRAACVVSGDTTAYRKPHPEPLLFAARTMRADPASCLYLGDDPRDVEAGIAAGMVTVIAGYGYIESSQEIERWGANGSIQNPKDLLLWLPNRDKVLACR